jgi:energy-converting hydrogenase Eha subunit H
MELVDLIAAVAGDIAYLIATCHQKTKNSTAVGDGAGIVKKMEKPIRTALALLCGTYTGKALRAWTT